MFFTKLLAASPVRRPGFVRILEVGPRDGLQNESAILSVDQKLEFIHRLRAANIDNIEVGSLVNYNKVPQMSGTPQVLKRLNNVFDTRFSVLVPAASKVIDLEDSVDEIVLFVSASETFNKKNINTNIDGSFARFEAIIQQLKEQSRNVTIRGSISCCWGCPYEGSVSIRTIVDIMNRYQALGASTLDICDTIGIASPSSTRTLLSYLLELRTPASLSLHLHDTNGKAIPSALAAAEMGINYFHSSTAGIGGCPFSPTRVGNVDTLRLVQALHQAGYKTNIDTVELESVSKWIRDTLLKSKLASF